VIAVVTAAVPAAMPKGDLHVHSRHSDGSLSVREIVAESARIGLDFVSVVDHDTTSGAEELFAAGTEFGVVAIPGIEVSAADRASGKKVHVLGYRYRLPAKSLSALCGRTLADRDALTRRQIGRLSDAGYPVSVGEVEAVACGSPVLYKQHVMAVLVARGAADGIQGMTYARLFKNGGICAGEIDYPDAFDALRAIREDGGLAVLAHPGQLDSWHLVDRLVDEGLGGVELNHRDHRDGDRARVREIAARYPWLVLTGGSDFHGAFGRADDSIGSVLAPDDALARMDMIYW
jgi:phosphoribosyl 1,2-cyclic phosphate 1,2-diphosphodiesterase